MNKSVATFLALLIACAALGHAQPDTIFEIETSDWDDTDVLEMQPYRQPKSTFLLMTTNEEVSHLRTRFHQNYVPSWPYLLAAGGSAVVDSLLFALQNGTKEQRQAALYAVQFCDSCQHLQTRPEIFGAIAQLIPQSELSIVAMQALPIADPTRAIELLMKTWKDPKLSDYERGAAMTALRSCSPTQPLITTLIREWKKATNKDQDLFLRLEWVLAELRKKASPELLLSIDQAIAEAFQEAKDWNKVDRHLHSFTKPPSPVLLPMFEYYLADDKTFPFGLWGYVSIKREAARPMLEAHMDIPMDAWLAVSHMHEAWSGDPAAAEEVFVKHFGSQPDLTKLSVWAQELVEIAGWQALQAYLGRYPHLVDKLGGMDRCRFDYAPLDADHPLVSTATQLFECGALHHRFSSSELENIRNADTKYISTWKENLFPKVKGAIGSKGLSSFYDPDEKHRFIQNYLLPAAGSELAEMEVYHLPAFGKALSGKPQDAFAIIFRGSAYRITPDKVQEKVGLEDCVTAINSLLDKAGIPRRFTKVPFPSGVEYLYMEPQKAAQVFTIMAPDSRR